MNGTVIFIKTLVMTADFFSPTVLLKKGLALLFVLTVLGGLLWPAVLI